MRFKCKCGCILNDHLTPNDTEYHVYSDIEWSEFEEKENINFLEVPFPKYEVWHCKKCDRIYLFKDMKVYKVYRLENDQESYYKEG